MKNKLFLRQTKRLIIRPLEKSDYDQWKLAYSTMLPQKNKFDHFSNKKTLELTKIQFTKLLKGHSLRRKNEQYCDYAVFLKSTGAFIGRIGLGHFVRSVTQSASVGYSLFNRYWGMGYAQESVNALIDIAFRDHHLHRIVAGIEPDNKKSIQLIKKLGFRKEGISKRIVLLRNEWQDLVQFALTTEDRKMKWSDQIQARKK